MERAGIIAVAGKLETALSCWRVGGAAHAVEIIGGRYAAAVELLPAAPAVEIIGGDFAAAVELIGGDFAAAAAAEG